MPEHPDRPPIKAPPLPGPPTEKKPEETKALVPSTRPPILDLNPDVIKHLKKRKLELGEGPLVPVEKGGKPVFFSAEVPKIFVPDEFVNFDPVLKNLDLLSPSSSYWMDFFGGLAETPFGKKAQGLTESKILGPIFNLLIEASETAEKFVGYGYQAFFEPELRTPDAIGFLMSRNRKLLTDPQFAATVIQSGIYTAKQRNILGAWWAARQTYEALKLGESGPGIAIRTALKASPVFALLGKENKEVTILMWKLLGRSIGKVEQAPAEERAVGPLGIREADIIGVRQIEITDEEMALLHKWDLDWIFASLTDPEQLSDYVLEKQQRFMDYNEAFINGTYYREYFGLPILVDMRLAIMNGADPDLVQGAYTEGLGALAFEAQLDNMIFGSMIDPINLVSLAPVGEGVKFIRNVALTSRLAPKLSNAVDDILRLSSKLDDLAKVGQFDLFGDALKDLRKVADDLDLGRFTKVVDDIERAVGAGGKPHSGSLYAKTEEVLGELRNVVISEAQIVEGKNLGVAMRAGTIIQNVDPKSGLITKWKKIGGKKAFAGQWRQLDSAGVETAVIVGADSTEGANIVMRGKQIGEVVQSTAELRKAIKGFEPVMKDWSELHRMSYVERIIVAISGGDPLNPSAKWEKLGFPWRINPISLSASARAQEFVSGLHNALTPLLREAADWKAMVKVIKAGAAGIFGRRFGHAFVSPVGRYVQTILKRMTEHVTDLAEVYVKTAPQRAMANSIARISGMDIVAWMQRASAGGDDVAVLWKQFTKALIGADETIDVLNLRKLIADGLLSEDTIKNLGELFKSTPTKIIPYTDDLFRAEILRHSIDVAAEYAVKHFGVKEARSIQKFANYIKAPESLLLLGFNPFYPVLNFFNGETTMMFRGTWGLFAPRRWIPKAVRKFIPSMEDTWEAYRMEPARLHEGFSVAGLDNFQDVLKASAGPEKAALASGREMIRATVAGTPGKIGRIYFNAIAKVRGMRALAAATESWESARITTVAFQKAIRMLKSSYSKIDQVVPGLSDEIRVVDRALVGVLEDAVKSGRNSDEILAVAKAENITINLETLLRRTAESMGLDSKKMSLYVGEEINEIVRKTLVNLGPNPSADNIRDSFRQIGDFVQNYLDETVGASIPIQIAEAATKTEAEGPRAVLQLLSEASQTLFDRRASHMKFLDNNLSDVWEITDVALRDATFKAVLETADASWNRYWNLAEAVKRGIEKGLKARGMDVPDSFLGSMVRERMGAQTFIKLRNKLWTEHVGKLKTKKEFDKALRLADRAAIQETLDLEYMKLIDLTVASRKEMDGIFQLLMPEGTAVDLRNAVAGWREVIVRAVRADMEGVIEHRQNIRGLSPQAKAEAWTRFGEARRGADIELGRLEDAGYLMLNGDEQATRYFVQQAQELGISAVDDVAEQMFAGRKAIARIETESLELLEKAVSGKTLTPDEAGQVDKLVKRFLTEGERAQLDDLGRKADVLADVVGAGKRVKRPFEMSREEYFEAIKKAQIDDASIEIEIFGAEGAKAYKQAVRRTGSPLTSRADFTAASTTVREMEAALTPAQRNRLFGIGEEGPFYEDLRDFRFAFEPLDDAPLESLFGDVRRNITDVGPKKIRDVLAGKAEFTSTEEIAYVTSREAIRELNRRGISADDIMNQVATELSVDVGEEGARLLLQEWIDNAKAPRQIGALPDAVPDLTQAAIVEYPRQLRVQTQWIAQQMLDDIQIGEPGQRLFFYDRGPGVDVVGLGSGRPPWYNQFLQAYNTNRDAVLNGLEKIVKGEGDKGIMVERLKNEIFGELKEGPRGNPPDPIVLRILGEGQEKIDEAMEAWKQTGFDPLSEAAASQHAERLQLNHSVLTRIYEEFEAGAAQISKDMNEIDDAIESAAGFPVLPEFDRVVGRQLYQGTGFDELWFEHGATIVQKMEREAIKMLDEPSRRISDLPASTQSKVMQYLDHMVGEFRDVRQAAIRIGEGQRDTALLNYSRTYNVDNWLAVGLPFHFWYTHSVARWALSALDRPMILANYAKLKLFMDNVMGQNEGFPQRLRGHVKIEMPFAPEEAGDIYVNPFRIFGLPFEQFTQPFERAAQNAVSVENRVIRTLDELLEAQTISKQQHEEAIVSKEGELWDRARVLVENDEDRLRFDMLDFMNLSISPHVPIQIAWNLLRGTPEELNPLPHTRGLRHVATALGIDVGVYDKVWGNVRQAVGLPAFDQYDPYRVRRELSNFLGEDKVIDGKPVVQSEILLAMATEEGELYDQARQVVAEVEKFRYFSRFFGIPANPYPPGEENLRSLYNEFYGSFRLKDQGDDRAMGRFFDAHPEFEGRLALWKTPEEQLRSFLVDQVWNWWWDAPKIHRDEAKVQLGDLFALGFINKETRATDAISLDVLTTWVHLLGGTAPGQLSLDGGISPIQFTDPVVANKLQVFYDIRSNIFDYSNVVWPLQQEYFRLDKGDARKAFALAHDVLPKWWTYRRDFMIRNPDLIPYIEDDPERQPTFPSEAALRAATAAQPDFSKFEWQQALGGSAYNLTMDLVVDGDALPMVVRDHLDAVAEDIGISGWRELVSKFAKAHRLEEPDRPLIQVPQDERILEQVNILE